MALRGLTAQDRADWEKQYAGLLKGKDSKWIENAWVNWNFEKKYKGNKDYATLKTMKVAEKEKYWNDEINKKVSSYTFDSDLMKQQYKDSMVLQSDVTAIAPHPSILTKNDLDLSAEYIASRDAAAEKYGVKFEKDYLYGRDWTKNIKKVADTVSPYYRKYKGTDKLPLTDDEWKKLAIDYLAEKDSAGEEYANRFLLAKLEDIVNDNTGLAERLWNGFLTMGMDATASAISLVGGLAVGTYNEITGKHEDIEGASGFTNFIDAVLDNSVTRYANDVMLYGTLFTDRQKKAQEIGLSELNLPQSYEQALGLTSILEDMFNQNTMANLVGQYGFTLASMLEGWGATKLTSGAFRLYKGATIANKMQRTGQTAMQLRNTLTKILKAENFVNRTIIPGIVGTGEGMMEGLLTKLDFMEDGKKYIVSKLAEVVLARFEALMAEKYLAMYDKAKAENGKATEIQSAEFGRLTKFNPLRTDEEIQQDIINQLYQEAWNSYSEEYNNSLEQLEYAAAKAGVTNFMINSAINGGINSTLKADIFLPKTKNAIKSERLGKIFTPKSKFNVDASGKVSASLPWYKQSWNFLKEPTGEAVEEALQTLSDKYAQGVAANNIANFVYHRYNGEVVEIGETWANDYTAGLKAMGEAFTDRELYLNAFYGFASDALGGVNVARRARRADGSKGRLFERGLNESGQKESTMEMIARLTPWRSGIVLAYLSNKAQKQQLKTEVEMLLNWIDDPQNRAKFDGLAGTFSWAKDILISAENNDEFGYRNSVLGKTVNDVMMLQKLQGTLYYDSFMEQLNEAANLLSGTKVAEDYIKSMRNGLSTKAEVENMSDDLVLQLVKDNAKSMLNKMDEIQLVSDKLESLLGNIDIDTKESLVYGELQIKDWNKRAELLDTELKQFKFNDTVDSSSLSKGAKAIIASYGSIAKAFEARDKIKKNIQELSDNISNISKRKHLTDKDKQNLNNQKLLLKQLKKALQRFDSIKDIDLSTLVLSESEIMELDPITRANMLNPNERSKFSEALQTIIDNIVNQGNAGNIEFLNKIKDSAKIRQSLDKYINQYNAILADPNIFKAYVWNARTEASKAVFKKRYDKLRNIQDYNEFAKLMDKLMIDGSVLERLTIESQFRRDEKTLPEGTLSNYSKYIQQRKQVADILKYASKSKKLASLLRNDIDMFTHAISYLTELGIDLNDETAVINTLTEVNELGKNKFQQYVEDVNSSLEENDRTEFTNLEGTLLTVKTLLLDYLESSKELADNYTPISVDSQADINNNPPAPTIFDTAPKTLEEANESLKQENTGTLVEGTTLTETGETVENTELPKVESKNTLLSEYVLEYELNSASEVLSAARNIEYLANEGAKQGKLSNEQKQTILDILKILGKDIYTTTEELVNALIAEANKLDTQNGDITTALNLRDYTQKVLQHTKKLRLQAKRKAKLEAANQEAILSKSPLMLRVLGYSTLDVRDSNNMSTVDISWLKSTFSINPNDENYSPILEYIELNKVEDFLKNNELTRDTPVYFVYDPILSSKLRLIYTEKGFPYTDSNTAVVAVVKHSKGTLEINGEKYQPIGVMPSSGAKNTLGSNRIEKVRNKIIGNATAPYILSDAQGVIETRLSNHVFAKPMELQYTNVSLFDGILNDLTFDERASIESTPIELRKSNPVYWKKKQDILSRITLNSTGNDTHLELNISNLMGKVIPIRIFVLEISKSMATNKDMSIIDMLRANDIDVLNANSRLSRWSKTIESILKEINSDDIVLTPDGKLTKEALDKINSILETLNSKLKNYLYPKGYTLTINFELSIDGVNQYSLSMTNGVETIHLGAFDSNGITNELKLEVLKNMILQGNNVRMINDKNCLVKWLVNYRDFVSEDTNAKKNASDIFDDNILETSKKNLSYLINGVTLEAPYTMEGLKRSFTLTANPDNASTNPNTDTTKAANGATIDTLSGVVISGETPTITNYETLQAETIGKLIVLDSSQFTRTENGYTVNGIEFTNVDSYIDNSENYQKTIKSVVKSIFDYIFNNEKIDSLETIVNEHSNITAKAFKNFTDLITALKNKFISEGITFIPNIVATWLSNDIKLALNIFLGYDLNGKWHAYYPVISDNITDSLKKELAELMSMMTSTLAKLNNITIQDFTIIPILVSYPRANNISINGTQVLINKKTQYLGASPRILGTNTYIAENITSYKSITDKIGLLSNELITEETPDQPIDGGFNSGLGSLFGDTFGNATDNFGELSSYIPNSQVWGIFEGRGLNIEETMKNLQALGITEESWNNMTDVEREHELNCKGVY